MGRTRTYEMVSGHFQQKKVRYCCYNGVLIFGFCIFADMKIL